MATSNLTPGQRQRSFKWTRQEDKLIDPKTGREVIFLEDGTELHLAYYESELSKLFCSDDKRWFHLCADGKLTEVSHTYNPYNRTPGRGCHNGIRGNTYPFMRHFHNRYCHHLVYEAWVGKRHWPDLEIDHKNGNIYDYTPGNLEEVTKSENYWRASHVLQVLRSKGINPCDYTGQQMDKWFAIFRILEQEFTTIKHWQTWQKEDYLFWLTMPLDDFKALWSKYPKMEGSPEEIADYWDWRGRIESRA